MNSRGITGGQSGSRVLIQAASAVDSRGEISPAAILLEDRRILEVGAPESVGAVADASVVDARSEVVMPGLANAHAHLDLSGPGPLPYEGDFEKWLRAVIQLRMSSTREDVSQAVARGVELSSAGGTFCIGDIAGMPHESPLEVLDGSPLQGVSYAEFFGLGDTQDQTIDRMQSTLEDLCVQGVGVRLGLSPHAPYTCGEKVVSAAAASAVPMAIHVAESEAELDFLANGSGPFRSFAEMLKTWNDGVVIPEQHPIDYTLDCLGDRAGSAAFDVLLVHLNYLEDRHLEPMLAAGVTPVYCPRASAYFGYPNQGVHPYLKMLEHGLPVALGTDSLLCLDTPDRISILDEMRFLHRRDGTEAGRLITMATCHGARGLGLDEGLVQFTPGDIGGILAVSSGTGQPDFNGVLRSYEPPRWIMEPVQGGLRAGK